MEAEQDESTYKRELLARMFGGKLTSRQFGVLLNMPQDQQDKERIARKEDYKLEHKAKDTIRNIEEIVESHRRNKVTTGEWTEDESRLRMQIKLDDWRRDVSNYLLVVYCIINRSKLNLIFILFYKSFFNKGLWNCQILRRL